LFDPSFKTKDDQNDLDDWSCKEEEELDDVEFAANNDDVPFFATIHFSDSKFRKLIYHNLGILLCGHWQEDAAHLTTFQYSSLC
jgi:hypothetical protein